MHKLYSVFDSKAEYFSAPFTMKSKGEAIRAFAATANGQDGQKTQISQNPEDFTLFELGEWNEAIGVITLHKTAVSIGKAIEFIKS